MSIVCFGDSLTQHGYDVAKRGWVAQLSHAYLRRLDVINRGYSGYTSRWVQPLVPMLSQWSPRLLVILFGSNDAMPPPSTRHVPIAEFRRNIEQILASIDLSATSVVLVTPPSLGVKLYEATNDDVGRTFESVKECADAVREIASAFSVPCADLWTAVEEGAKEIGGEMDGYDAYSYDGVHLSAGGNDLLFDVLMRTIRSQHPHLDPDSMPFTVPYYRDVDAALADGMDVTAAVLRK
ncbi:isoamyl acetate-hydrolyzing esterase [Coemansia aciculifera]|uniref:Isoamyl acetate-hydrolyzing esterase n=1 Tax=Coemansia aciculifera TaxID=417176 RepID=A0ACC1M420_9FUNG|nr:isoamyl acetate-hydrolyzing esterase [Coemansia aciculifera]